MWGTKSRLDAVWVSIALDYLAHRLESGEGSVTDVISLVTLGRGSKVVFQDEPCDWLLCNKIVDLYMKIKLKPHGPGRFLPSLDLAKRMLTRNFNASCAMSLVFLSDGRPSDTHSRKGFTRDEWIGMIEQKTGDLAKQYGRRLTYTAI
jgi:hypothetical protein